MMPKGYFLSMKAHNMFIPIKDVKGQIFPQFLQWRSILKDTIFIIMRITQSSDSVIGNYKSHLEFRGPKVLKVHFIGQCMNARAQGGNYNYLSTHDTYHLKKKKKKDCSNTPEFSQALLHLLKYCMKPSTSQDHYPNVGCGMIIPISGICGISQVLQVSMSVLGKFQCMHQR